MKKILIVDDEQDWVKMLAIRLTNEGYEIEAAFDALQAISQTKEQKPDLVLLDIMMPAGGGIEVLKNIKNNIKTFNTPVIIVTAKSDEKTKEEAEKIGAADYFVKSTDVTQLIEKVKKVLG